MKTLVLSLSLLCTFCFSSMTFADTTHWRFTVASDSHVTNSESSGVMLGKIAQSILKDNVDLTLWGGDIVDASVWTNDGFASQLRAWRNVLAPIYDAGIGVYPVRGNHGSFFTPGWQSVFSDLPDNGPEDEKYATYSFSHNGAFFVGLDQWGSHPYRVNQTWLDAQFAANTSPLVFVFGHTPAYSVYHGDCLDDYPAQRDAFIDSIAAEGGRTYFCGHDHSYNHAEIDSDGNPDNDIHQIVVGSAGTKIYPWYGTYNGNNSGDTVSRIYSESNQGYVLVDVNGLDVTMTWKAYDPLTDSFVARDQWGYTAVPEPAGLILVLIGGFILRRKRKI
jgi:hypothetical protein